MAKTVHIAVLDDHRMFLEGLSMLVESMVGHYSVTNFHEPVELLHQLEAGQHYDLVLCDLIMNRMNGLAFVAAARAYTKRIPILMISGINTPPPLAEMQSLGASGFVHKSADNETFLKAIETVLRGKAFFEVVGSDDVAADLCALRGNEDSANSLIEALPSLGKRQVEVLKMIAHGASNKEISNTLSISENTVKTHLKQIFMILGVNKRTACVRKAQALGLI
ncbi:response regulator [Kordiimonas pumila]|uniref:Response regulator n=1 Tax=Kordiimonas pumila TaxID=2161677 RepID=A0ABV7D4K0_9PROT|nr:response regulator transcription factor [Kordiimonas pumila]